MELNKIIHGDCMDIMRDIPDKYFELAIVDPPYGLKSTNFVTARLKKREDKKWNNAIPDKIYFDELYRISKNQIIWGENYYNQFIKHPGRIVFNKLMTSKNGPLKLSDCDLASCSIGNRIMLFEYQWSGNVQNGQMNCANIDNWGKGLEKRIHPTQKPVALYRWLLQKYANPGDKIIDTHSGSGSCAIACFLEHYDFIAIEKDDDYHAASVARYNEIVSQGRLF